MHEGKHMMITSSHCASPRRRESTIALLCMLVAIASDAAEPARVDMYGDPLPKRAVLRLGTARFRHGFGVGGLAFSPDGKKLASVGDSRALCLWDVASGKLLHEFPNSQQNPFMEHVAFSPDGKILAGLEGTNLILWDTESFKIQRKFEIKDHYPRTFSFAQDGKAVIIGGESGSLRLWDIASGDLIHPFAGVRGDIWTIALSARGQILACEAGQGKVRLWDVATGRAIRDIGEFGGNHLHFSPLGGSLAACGYRLLKTIDLTTGKPSFPGVQVESRDFCMAYAPDSKTIAHSSGTDIVIIDATTGKPIRRWTAQRAPLSVLEYSPDGKVLASGSCDESGIHLWDPSTGKEIRPRQGHAHLVNKLVLTPDDDTLYSLDFARQLLPWDLTHARVSNDLARIFADPVGAFALAPQGKTAAVVDKGGERVKLLELPSGALLHRFAEHPTYRRAPLEERQAKPIISLCYSSDGKNLASLAGNDTLLVWDVASWKLLKVMKGAFWSVPTPDSSITIAFTHDNNRIVATDSSFAKVRDVRIGDLKAEIYPKEGQMELAVSRVSRLLAVTENADGAVLRLVDALSGKEVRRSAGTGSGCYSVAFSPNGRLLASGGSELDSVIRLWETATGREVCRFPGQGGGIFSLTFSHDGRVLVSGGGDTTIVFWEVPVWKQAEKNAGPLAPEKLSQLWDSLVGEPSQALRAIDELNRNLKPAIPYVQKHLSDALTIDATRTAKWVENLESPIVKVREEAAAKLIELGMDIEPALRKVLAENPSLDLRKRLERVLDKILESPRAMRVLRVIQLLEYAGTDEAKQSLSALAKSPVRSLITDQAKDALDRLK
jgi:WD40 repeat protein